MGKSSFLDKGILLGYCFSIDVHHKECETYLHRSGLEVYFTEEVQNSFSRNKTRMVVDHRKDILHHARVLEKSSYSGELGPMELKQIQQSMISQSEYPNAWRYLRDYYEKRDLISLGEITAELRELAREIESNAEDSYTHILESVNLWERTEDYPDVQSALDEIRLVKEEDFWICIDAHDLANRLDGHTELATTDFEDLVHNGRRELIVDNSAIDDVVGVGVTTRQR